MAMTSTDTTLADGAPHIVVAGAGSVGCFIGGMVQGAGTKVTLLGRARIADELADHGLTLTDAEGGTVQHRPDQVTIGTDPALLGQADLILVTVKSGATADMADLISVHARAGTPVVSLQNGVGNAAILRERLAAFPVLAGMVPFNVLHMGDGRFHRGSSGKVIVQTSPHQVEAVLHVPGLDCVAADDMQAVLWGKLVMNLNNALNALSGMGLRDQLEHPGWRRLLADMQTEAYGALKAAGIRPKAATPLPPLLTKWALRLPTPLFKLVAGRTLKIDPKARSSMWEDLERRRPTEVDELQGAVVRLAAAHGLGAPLCARVAAAIRVAEQRGAGSPFMIPDEIQAV